MGKIEPKGLRFFSKKQKNHYSSRNMRAIENMKSNLSFQEDSQKLLFETFFISPILTQGCEKTNEDRRMEPSLVY